MATSGALPAVGERSATYKTTSFSSLAIRLNMGSSSMRWRSTFRDGRDRQPVLVHLVGLCASLESDLPPGLLRNLFELVLNQRSGFAVLTRGRVAPAFRHRIAPTFQAGRCG
jgi:hypothetical protein